MTIQESHAARFAPHETIAQALGNRLVGCVVLSGAQEWDITRKAWNLAVDPRVDANNLYPAETFELLRWVKAQYDPGDLIRSNHPIPPQS